MGVDYLGLLIVRAEMAVGEGCYKYRRDFKLDTMNGSLRSVVRSFSGNVVRRKRAP